MALIGGKKDKEGSNSNSSGSAQRRGSTGSGRDDSSSERPLDPMIDVKKRARRRLIGAIALVVGAIVFVPMIFDSGRKPAVDDIVIQIPDKNSAFPSSGAEQKGEVAGMPPASGTVQPDGASSTGVPRPASGGYDLASPPPTGSASPKPPDSAVASEKPHAAANKPPEQSPRNTSNSEAVKAGPANAGSKDKIVKAEGSKSEVPVHKDVQKDDPRALALLNGKMADAAVNGSAKASSQTANAATGGESKPEPRGEAKGESYAVQIGAFSDASKLQSLRQKLDAGGLKTYTEVVKTPQGNRTRLRLGPYPSREAAGKAQEKVKKLFAVEASVVPL
jgi:DedD protein